MHLSLAERERTLPVGHRRVELEVAPQVEALEMLAINAACSVLDARSGDLNGRLQEAYGQRVPC